MEVVSRESSTATTTSVATTEGSGNIGTPPSEEDEAIISGLCKTDWYNPLEDTRPFYYATYDDVRSTGQVYFNRNAGGTKYIIDSDLGDEYQLVSSAGSSTSFMDVLNDKVVFQT